MEEEEGHETHSNEEVDDEEYSVGPAAYTVETGGDHESHEAEG